MKLLSLTFLAFILRVERHTDATLLPIILHSLPQVRNLYPVLPQVHRLLPTLPQRQTLLPSLSLHLHRAQDSALQCSSDQSVQFRNALYEFSLHVYNALTDRVDEHFVTSPYSIWLTLAALAEGADFRLQAQLFKVLGLPSVPCLRQKFYMIALSLETPGTDVSLLRHRGIVFDDGVKVDDNWANFVKTSKLIEYVFAPIKAQPQLTQKNLRRAIGSRMNMPLEGNSVIIDSLTYRALWTNAFDGNLTTEPFYDDNDNQIGTVQMMRVKLQARIAELPQFHAKVVELPVGDDGRYSMLIGLGMEKTGIMRKLENLQHGKIINEVLHLLHPSAGHIEIAIPKFSMKTSYDARVVLESLGFRDFWTNPDATRYVSDPPALPGGLVQRVKVSFAPEGVSPPAPNNIITLLGELANTIVGHSFIANKPFMYVFIESKTQNVLFAGCYSDPNRG